MLGLVLHIGASELGLVYVGYYIMPSSVSDRRGQPLPGGPPVPSNQPPPDVDPQWYAAQLEKAERSSSAASSPPRGKGLSKGYKIPKKAQEDDSSDESDEVVEADDDTEESSDDERSPSEGDDDDSDSAGSVAEKKTSRKRKRVESDSDSDSDDDRVNSSQGRRMWTPGAANIIRKRKLRKHHAKYLGKHFSKYVTLDKTNKELKTSEIPDYKSPFLTVKDVDTVLKNRVTLHKKQFERNDRRYSAVEKRLYASTRPLLCLLETLEDADPEEGVDPERLLQLGEAALSCIGQASVELKFNRRQAVLGNVMGDHEKAKQRLKDKENRKLMDADPTHLFGDKYNNKFHKELKLENRFVTVLGQSKRRNQGKKGAGNQPSSSGQFQPNTSKSFRFNKPNSQKPAKKKNMPFRPASGGSGGPPRGNTARYVCLLKFRKCSTASGKKPSRKIPFFNAISKVRDRRESFENSDRFGLCPDSPTRVSWGEGEILSEKLEGFDSRSLDLRSGSGQRDRLGRDSNSVARAETSGFRRERKSLDRSGGSENARFACNRDMCRCSRSICEYYVSEGQTRRGQETNFQCESTESVYRVQAFQAGGHPSVDRSNPAHGLDVQDRSLERVLECPSSGERQNSDEVQVAGSALPVSDVALRFGARPKVVDQALEAGNGAAEEARGAQYHLHGRCLGRRSRSLSLSPARMSDRNAFRISWFHQELKKEFSRPYSDHGRLSWLYRQLNRNDSGSSKKENSENSKSLSESAGHDVSHGKGPSESYRSAGSNIKGSVTSSLTLQDYPNGADICSPQRTETVQHCTDSQRGVQSGVEMVDSQSGRLEWKMFHCSFIPGISTDRDVGCFRPGVGLGVRRDHSPGSLDECRDRHAHQSQRVDGGIDVGESFHQGQACDPRTRAIRQSYDCQSNSKNGFNKVKEPVQYHSRPMAILSEQRHNADIIVSERYLECDSRQGVKGVQGLKLLETEPSGFQSSYSGAGGATDRFVRRQDKFSTPGICELEARPSSSPHGRICNQVAQQGSPVSVSPVQSDREMSSKNSGRKSDSHSDHTYMAGTDFLPSTAANVRGRSNSAPADGESSARTHGRRTSSHKHGFADVGSMESLRRNARCKGLSEQAKELLQGKLAKGTQKTYGSPWKEWHSWCHIRDLDPVSVPVEVIANWLALYCETHGYSATNTARSAISAYHNRVYDGQNLVPVGQHDLIVDLLDSVKARDPPQARYTETWDVNIVLEHIISLGPNCGLTMKTLSYKLAMLINLGCVTRTQELSVLKLSNIKSRSRDKVVFAITDRTKTGRKQVTLNRVVEYEGLDPVSCFETYVVATQAWRISEISHDGLFLALNEPHQAVKPSCIARWLTQFMEEAGINVETYKAHSVRSASTSKAKNQKSMSCAQILKAASWANAHTFRQFYHKDIESAENTDAEKEFSNAVLSL